MITSADHITNAEGNSTVIIAISLSVIVLVLIIIILMIIILILYSRIHKISGNTNYFVLTEINYIVICSGSADRRIVTNTTLSCDRNSKKISDDKNPLHQDIHSIQTNSLYENVLLLMRL